MNLLKGCFDGHQPQTQNSKRTFDEAFGDEESKEINFTSLPKTIALNFTTLTTASNIKRQTQISLLMNLIESNITGLKLKCIGICPIIINLRFFKTSPEVLIEREPNLKLILENANPRQGIYRVHVLEACEKLSFSNFDLLNYLYCLQTKGELGYEVKDEGIFLIIEEMPSSYGEMMNYLLDKSDYLINLNIKKVNLFLILAKLQLCSISTVRSSFN